MSTKATRAGVSAGSVRIAGRKQQEAGPATVRSVPSDAEVEALLAAAAATRKKPSRGLWIAAIVVSAICVVALGWGLINYWDEPPEQKTIQPAARDGGGGFGLGLMVGIGVG